jgi:hypothetical protein
MIPLWGRQPREPQLLQFATASCMLVISVEYQSRIVNMHLRISACIGQSC